MKRVSLFAAVVLILIGCSNAESAPLPPETAAPLTLDAYKIQLQDWSQQLRALERHPEVAPQFRASLPDKSVVSESGRSLEVSNSWLNAGLVEFVAAKPERKPELLRQMQAHLMAQRQEADFFRQPPAYPASLQQRLNEILGRREFRGVHGPTTWDQWKRRVILGIIRWLDRIFRRVSYTPHGGEIVVWGVIAAVLIVAAIWLKRTAERQIIDWPREPMPFAPSEKHWRKWLAEAREAAQQDRWRDAIHLAYWAAISQLEQSGAWVPDRARTPREYLRVLPSASEKRPALDALTRRLEVVWYGHRDAGADDFADTLVQLERLGCR